MVLLVQFDLTLLANILLFLFVSHDDRREVVIDLVAIVDQGVSPSFDGGHDLLLLGESLHYSLLVFPLVGY